MNVDTRILSNEKLTDTLRRKKKNYYIMDFYEYMDAKYKEFRCTAYDMYDSHKYSLVEELEKLDYNPGDYYKTKAERIASCMNYWEMEIYHENKLMEFTRTFRCMDKFCPNCKRVRSAGYLLDFLPHFDRLSKQYKPYMFTLTVPNVIGDHLEETIKKLFEKFRILYRYFHEKKTSSYSHKFREYNIVGGIRSLEVTYNEVADEYHPHIHAMMFIEADGWSMFDKNIQGEFNYKSGEHNMISSADIEIRDLWTRLYNGIDRRVKEYDIKPYMCDIRPIEGLHGIMEVLKYSFKTSQIASYDVFETLYFALHSKRQKQGYGLLYNLKFEDYIEEKGLKDLLCLEIPEYESVLLKDLVGKYKDYTKVSRFKKTQVLELIDEYLED